MLLSGPGGDVDAADGAAAGSPLPMQPPMPCTEMGGTSAGGAPAPVPLFTIDAAPPRSPTPAAADTGRTDTPTPRGPLRLQRRGRTPWPLLQRAPLDLARGAPSASPWHRRRTPPARPISRQVSMLRPCRGCWRTWSLLKMSRMTKTPWRSARCDGLTW
jgi:hypothetical protein